MVKTNEEGKLTWENNRVLYPIAKVLSKTLWVYYMIEIWLTTKEVGSLWESNYEMEQAVIRGDKLRKIRRTGSGLGANTYLSGIREDNFVL